MNGAERARQSGGNEMTHRQSEMKLRSACFEESQVNIFVLEMTQFCGIIFFYTYPHVNGWEFVYIIPSVPDVLGTRSTHTIVDDSHSKPDGKG